MNDFDDPYRAPASDLATEPSMPDLASFANAGRGRRLLTFLVDYVGQLATVFLLTIVVVVSKPELAGEIESMSKPTEWAISLGTMLLYYVAFEGLFGRTPGKWICGTRVIGDRGQPPTLGQALGRTLARLVPFEPFSLLFSSDSDINGWHDRWANTRVVRSR